MNKRRFWIALLLTMALVLSACSAGSETTTETVTSNTGTETASSDSGSESDKLVVVATLFPQYDFAREIGGDKVDVTLILPPGVEAHTYEPTPQDMVLMQASDLFLYTGELMEPWAAQMTDTLEEAGVKVVDLSTGIELLSSEEEGHDAEDGDSDASADGDTDHDHGSYDPHFWTDPNRAMIMADNILASFIEKDPENASYYQANADTLKASLTALDADIRAAVEKMSSKTILSGGHFAFGYFVKQYGLEEMSPYAGFSPDAEPTPQRIAELIDTVKETGAKAIFYEELIDPKVATVISEEAGVQMLLLHGVHNVSKEELDSGKTYVDFMRENLERLKIGLDYHE